MNLMEDDKAVFEAFALSVALLVIKVLAMGPLTARHRFKHLVSASELMEIVRAKVKNSA